MGPYCLRGAEETLQVDVLDQRPSVLRKVSKGTEKLDAVCVDQMVDRAEVDRHGADRARNIVVVTDVDNVVLGRDAKFLGQAGGNFIRLGALEVEERDTGTSTRQFFANRLADATSCAGHDTGTALQIDEGHLRFRLLSLPDPRGP
jgi:hypothetical protein